jgi:hypothetical protein
LSEVKECREDAGEYGRGSSVQVSEVKECREDAGEYGRGSSVQLREVRECREDAGEYGRGNSVQLSAGESHWKFLVEEEQKSDCEDSVCY